LEAAAAEHASAADTRVSDLEKQHAEALEAQKADHSANLEATTKELEGQLAAARAEAEELANQHAAAKTSLEETQSSAKEVRVCVRMCLAEYHGWVGGGVFVPEM